jgi:proline dehydrogenase
VRSGFELRRLLVERLPGRALAARHGPRPVVADAVPVARALVDGGYRVALEHVPGPGEDPAPALLELVGRVQAAGLAAFSELTVPVDTAGDAGPVAAAALDAGLGVVLAGAAADVDAVGLAGAGVVVPAGEAGAEARCRALAGGHVRLVRGPGRRGAADLAFVRCLNVLMAGEGRPGIAVSDPRLIAIAGERAAWNGRPPDSWELVMPHGVLIHEQRRLVAAGDTVRVAVTQVSGVRS